MASVGQDRRQRECPTHFVGLTSTGKPCTICRMSPSGQTFAQTPHPEHLCGSILGWSAYASVLPDLIVARSFASAFLPTEERRRDRTRYSAVVISTHAKTPNFETRRLSTSCNNCDCI